MLAIIIIAFMSTIIYMIKRQNDAMRMEREAAAELRESDRSESQLREQGMQQREERMAKRIDTLEDQIKSLQKDHSEQLVQMIQQVNAAITESNTVLQNLTATMGILNGDLKEMCG